MPCCCYKIYNGNQDSLEWVAINCNLIMFLRQTTFMTVKNNNIRVGLNGVANRLRFNWHFPPLFAKSCYGNIQN